MSYIFCRNMSAKYQSIYVEGNKFQAFMILDPIWTTLVFLVIRVQSHAYIRALALGGVKTPQLLF